MRRQHSESDQRLKPTLRRHFFAVSRNMAWQAAFVEEEEEAGSRKDPRIEPKGLRPGRVGGLG